jgi:hypothetical protein
MPCHVCQGSLFIYDCTNVCMPSKRRSTMIYVHTRAVNMEIIHVLVKGKTSSDTNMQPKRQS